MPRRARRLGVWLGGMRVAELESRGFPEIHLRYSDEALDAWPENSPVVSCSLPLSPRPQQARTFCKGLLPEGRALQELAAQAGLAVNATFDLLGRYGRDVAGALIIGAEPPAEERFGIERYTREGLATAVDELDDYPLGSHDDSELSLPGLQDKLLLVDLGEGDWGRPLRGRPSTHILKADDRRRPGLVRAEAECLDLAHDLGLTSIVPRIDRLGEVDCLIVARFDRVVDDGAVRRIHQEDACQALGIDHESARGRAKYESAGGPTLRRVAELLDTHAVDADRELDRLVASVTFTVLIGNADAHGKNIALLHPTPETVTLASLYDTVPTVIWPKLRTAAAMSIGGRTSLPEVTLADVVREARSWGHSEARAEAVAMETVEQIADALDRGVVPPTSPVAELVRGQVARLLGA